MATINPANRVTPPRLREPGGITVRNINREKVATSNHKLPLISISDRYGAGTSVPGVKAGRHVLFLEFFAGDHWDNKAECITEDHAKKIFDFWQALPPDTKEVLVNCGEGRIRSYTVCEVLYRVFENVSHHEGSGQHDRHTYHMLRRWLEAMVLGEPLEEDEVNG